MPKDGCNLSDEINSCARWKRGARHGPVEPGGAISAEYSYNDHGRGDHIVATWKLDASGVPVEYEGRGNDYMKAPIEERFETKDGRASWRNRSEKGDQAVTMKAFYLPMNAPPEFTGVLARALLKAPDRKLALLPAGEASIEEAGITIIPGTDALPGYTLHQELEVYVRAGIPVPEVLRMATLTSAQVMNMTKDRGAIAAGKLADMILVDGDPAKNIRDIRNITTVIKGGKIYDPATIEKAPGIAPRPARP